MSAKNEHLIVIPVEPLKFAKKIEVWPLHITIVPWFHCSEDDKPKLVDLLERIAKRHKKFNVKVGQTEDFGKSKKFLVQLIDQAPQLTQLHLDVFESLESNGFPIHQKDYLGDNYRPHFIYKKDDIVPEGSVIEVSKFSLIKQDRLKVTGKMIKQLDKDFYLESSPR